MKIRFSGLVPESVVDGDGFRFAVFTQGCPHHCKGCHNPQTWDFSGGEFIDVDEIVARIKKNPLLSGVTFSGGEPFMQPEALTELAQKVHGMGLDVWSWSGFTIEQILSDPKKKGLLDNIDVLVDGPFVLSERDLSLRFRGSRNQRVIDVKRSMESGQVVLLYND